MKKQISEQDISRLISRFMDGDTTLAEERLLADYFRTARHIPSRWQTYKQMFACFDSGTVCPQKPESTFTVCLRRYRFAVAAVALLVVIIVPLAMFYRSADPRPASGSAPRPVSATILAQEPVPVHKPIMDTGRQAPVDNMTASPAVSVTTRQQTSHYPYSAPAVTDGVQTQEERPSTADITEMMAKAELADYNKMVESEYNERREQGECCMLVEDIDGYYEVKECIPDMVML